MRDLWCDTETYCDIPIKHGTFKYAERVEVILFTWAIDDGPVSVWDVAAGEPCPPELEAAIHDPECLVWFQNGGKFDWPVLAVAMPWIDQAVPLERRRDTMVMAYSHSLPGGLEMMADALGVAQDKRKLASGKALIRLFCMPPPKNVTDRSRRTQATHRVEWEQFKEYASFDIIAMRECKHRCPQWNYKGKQLLLEQLDARINARGITMDTALAEAAVRVSEIAKRGLAARTQEMTGGDVDAATQRDEMLAHILSLYGVELPDMQKDTIERRIADENLPEELRELLRVRLQSTTTSVAKFTTLLNGVNSDGRLRGTMQFRGAGRTGRVGHRLFQPGNMPRPSMKADEIEWAIDLLKLDAAHLVYDNVMRVCSNAIRGTIIAPPDKKLVVADLANIEGRVAAWLAGEDWKLQAFRDFDAGTGADLYILAYASSFNVPAESIDKSTIEGYAKRQIGKVEELMFQYGGGVGAWITGAATYGIDLDKMTEQVYDTIPEWAIAEAKGFLEWLYEGPERKALHRLAAGHDAALIAEQLDAAKLKARHMLPEKTFIACDAIKRLWRKAHPEISSYWKELEGMVRAAIENPGQRFTARKLVIQRDGAWLRIALPSGRALCYPSPAWDLVVPAKDGKPAKHFDGFSYMGIHQYTKQWTRLHSYGGKIFENVVQAVAADQLLECGLLVDEAGFDIVLSVHDEYITEAEEDKTVDELCTLMCSDLGWNKGLPLAATGYEAQRYKKD